MYPFALGRGGGWRRRRAARGVASPGTVTRAYWRPTLNISKPIFTVSLSIVRNKQTHREVSLGILLTRIFVRRSALGPRCCGFLKIRSFEMTRETRQVVVYSELLPISEDSLTVPFWRLAPCSVTARRALARGFARDALSNSWLLADHPRKHSSDGAAGVVCVYYCSTSYKAVRGVGVVYYCNT